MVAMSGRAMTTKVLAASMSGRAAEIKVRAAEIKVRAALPDSGGDRNEGPDDCDEWRRQGMAVWLSMTGRQEW